MWKVCVICVAVGIVAAMTVASLGRQSARRHLQPGSCFPLGERAMASLTGGTQGDDSCKEATATGEDCAVCYDAGMNIWQAYNRHPKNKRCIAGQTASYNCKMDKELMLCGVDEPGPDQGRWGYFYNSDCAGAPIWQEAPVDFSVPYASGDACPP
jgi:hypothetical protein